MLAGDELSRASGVWLLNAMVGENIDGAVEKLMAVASIGPLLGPGLIFVFSILGIIGTAVQAVFILIQIAMLRLVLGWMPIAAAAYGIGSAGCRRGRNSATGASCSSSSRSSRLECLRANRRVRFEFVCV
ncbi:hypothetical protein GS532_21735 [Rhodococcus hoagii]|nr:hypothetical protein [Prescottella equi]